MNAQSFMHQKSPLTAKVLVLGIMLSVLQFLQTAPASSNYDFDGSYICATGEFPNGGDITGINRVVNGVNYDLIYVAWTGGVQYRLYDVVGQVLTEGSNCIGELVLNSGITRIVNSAFHVRVNGEPLHTDNTNDNKSTYFRGENEVSKITDITIPASLTSIGVNAFRNSTLSTIKFLGDAPFVGDDAFLNIPTGLTVYVSSDAAGFDSGVWLDFNVVRAPTLTLSSNSETKSVNSAITGYTISSTGGTITSYAITPSAPAGLSFNTTTGLLTGTPTEVSGATAFTITGTNGAGSATATFTLTVTTTNNSSSSGSGSTTTSTTAADELRRQQEAAQAAKQKQDQELREILSLVPTIAGLAQGIAGLGNSLLLPKKCVKGKVVKNVKAGAKCPKGYKARK